MSCLQNVLIVGSPFVYNFVDGDLIKENQLNLYYLYKNKASSQASNNDQNIFVEDFTIDEIKNVAIEHNIDGIVCFDDQLLLDVSIIRKELKLKGICYDEMRKFKYKSIMNDSLKEHIKTIPYLKLSSNLSFEDLSRLIGPPPYFVKPDSSAGSEGATKINDAEEYKLFCSELCLNKRDYIIQPYINGTLYHCELIVQNGCIIYSQARSYSYPNFKILSGKTIASFPIDDSQKRFEIEKLAAQVQQDLNFKNGLMHTEFFEDEKGTFLFVETNIRPAGGSINLIHQNRLGISLETVMILLEMGKKIDISINSEKLYTSGYIPMKKGMVTSFKYPKFKGKIVFNEKVKVGDVCHHPISASDASLSYVGEYDLLEDMLDDFKLIELSNIVQYDILSVC